MPKVSITRRERFSAAHKLWVNDWTEEKNLSTFGGCANPNWHGHNYELFVTVEGEVNPVTGFVVNLKDVSKILKTKVVNKLDHKNLNLDVDFMKGKMTSTENIAIAIWEQLEKPVTELGGILHCVKLQETEKNYAEYYGE